MNPYVLLAAVVGFVAAVGGAYVQGRSDGNAISDREHVAEKLQQTTETAIAINGAQTRHRAQEAQWQESFSTVSTTLQGKLDASKKALAIALAANRLRDPFAKPQTCGGATAEAAPSASGDNAPGESELSVQFDTFLKSEASRADKIVLKLTACQEILTSERAAH